MIWKDAVLNALRRFSIRHSTQVVDRQQLLDEELEQIIKDVASTGATPAQTLSRVIQELRDEGVLYFMDYSGSYLLADSVIQVETQDLPDDALDFAIRQNKLRVGIVPAESQCAVVRQRVGQDRIRKAVLENYGYQCAFCDIRDAQMLVASHISRWADDPDGRGDLTNIIGMCRFHDALFENGYFSLADDFSILKKQRIQGEMIGLLLDKTCTFTRPHFYAPSALFLQKHRARTGF